MLVRKLVTCHACQGEYILRFGVGLGFEQRLAWPCPLCEAEMRAHFSVKQKEVEADFKSDDITIQEKQPSDLSLPGVNLYSEIPVHKSSIGKGLGEGGSAWLFLMSCMTGEGVTQYIAAKEGMQMLREIAFSAVRRAASQAKKHEWIQLKTVMESTPYGILPDLIDRHPAYQFGRFLDTSFVPILGVGQKAQSGQEVMDLLNNSVRDYPAEYMQFLHNAFTSQGFLEAANRCLDTTLRLFEHYDSLILPLATEQFKPEWRDRIEEFRVYRDDFDVLKGIYQDIFESMNQLLVWLGMVANLSNRGDVSVWYNGKIASFARASRWKSVEKEFIINELPTCESLLGKASRSLRNNIGHFTVHYNVVSGEVVFSGGTRSSLLLFHEDLLAAARLLTVLNTFCEKVTLDYLRLVRHEPMRGWSK